MNTKLTSVLKTINGNIDIKTSTLLQAVVGAGKLILPQKAAMDEATYSDIAKSTNNYVLGGDTDLTLYTETDPGSQLTINSASIDVDALFTTLTSVIRNADNAGDFSHDFDFKNITTANTLTYKFIGLSNINDFWDNGSFNGVGCSLRTSRIYPAKVVNGAITVGNHLELTNGVQYYARISRSGTSVTLSIFTDAARTSHLAGSPEVLSGVSTDLYGVHSAFNAPTIGSAALSCVLSNFNGIAGTYSALTGTIISNSITKDANIGLRYWNAINISLTAVASGSTVKLKILNSAGVALHSNFVTVASNEFDRIPLERLVEIVATGDTQTSWDFTSLSETDALINELGVLTKSLLVELATNGLDFSILEETIDYEEDISNIKAPNITLLSGSGIINGTSILRATYIVNIPLSNTTFKIQLQLTRLSVGDASPQIEPLAGDSTKYTSGEQVAIL